eukprot:3701620-Pleurochrysis_carterae.AAC.4
MNTNRSDPHYATSTSTTNTNRSDPHYATSISTTNTNRSDRALAASKASRVARARSGGMALSAPTLLRGLVEGLLRLTLPAELATWLVFGVLWRLVVSACPKNSTICRCNCSEIMRACCCNYGIATV